LAPRGEAVVPLRRHAGQPSRRSGPAVNPHRMLASTRTRQSLRGSAPGKRRPPDQRSARPGGISCRPPLRRSDTARASCRDCCGACR
jgi:hypothetical protein